MDDTGSDMTAEPTPLFAPDEPVSRGLRKGARENLGAHEARTAQLGGRKALSAT